MIFDLSEIRSANNVTQQELGDLVGVTRQHISAIELKKLRPSVEVAKTIAYVLDFDWKLFFEDIGIREGEQLNERVNTY